MDTAAAAFDFIFARQKDGGDGDTKRVEKASVPARSDNDASDAAADLPHSFEPNLGTA